MPNKESPPSNRKILMNVNEISAYLKLRRQTIYNLVSQRRIPFIKLGRKGGRLRFDLQAINKWLEENSFKPVDLEYELERKLRKRT